MPIIVLYLVVVLAFFTLMQGLVAVFASPQRAESTSLRRKTLADGITPWLAEFVHDFENLVAISGSGVSPLMLLTGMAAATALAMLVAHFLAGIYPLSALVDGLTVGFALPVLFLIALRRRRLAKLVGQLPEALDMLVRSLRVGHPVPVGIEMIANEMPDPLGGEFRRVFDSMSYGLDLKEALEQMGRRLRVPEARYMVAAIRIQYATGGNLAEVLASLSEVMRERVRLKRKVKALTAETRLSGNIMSLMPFVLVAGLIYLRPDFYSDVPTSPVLQVILGGAGVLLAIGVVLMRHIVNIRV